MVSLLVFPARMLPVFRLSNRELPRILTHSSSSSMESACTSGRQRFESAVGLDDCLFVSTYHPATREVWSGRVRHDPQNHILLRLARAWSRRGGRLHPSLANQLSSEHGMMSAVARSATDTSMRSRTEQQGSLDVLRLPFRTDLRDTSVQPKVDRRGSIGRSPDWLSLQFVCWSASPHGVAWRLGPALRDLGGDVLACDVPRTVGRPAPGPEDGGVGPGQMAATGGSFTASRPPFSTPRSTRTSQSQSALSPADKLPLFGNIPVPPELARPRSRPRCA